MSESLKTQKYDKKPFSVEAVRVTQENLMAVLEWCAGVLFPASGKLGPFVKVEVRRPISERQTRAYIGDWVLKAGSGFKVYNDRAFFEAFQLQPANARVEEMYLAAKRAIAEAPKSDVFPGEPVEMQEELPTVDRYHQAMHAARAEAAQIGDSIIRSMRAHPSSGTYDNVTPLNMPRMGRNWAGRLEYIQPENAELPDDYWAGHPTD